MKSQNKVLTTIVTVIGIALCAVFGLLLILNLTIIVKGLINPKKPPSVFGVTPMVVKTGSMSSNNPCLLTTDKLEGLTEEQIQSLKNGETVRIKFGDFYETCVIDSVKKNEAGKVFMIQIESAEKDHIEVDDLIFAVRTDAAGLKVGEIISFIDKSGTVTTHRIIQLTTDEQGNTAYVTKGDANNTDDVSGSGKNGIVTQDKVVGVYKGRVPKIGAFIDFLRQPWGMIIFIGVPVVAYIVYDIIRRQRTGKKGEKKQEELEAELKRLRAIAAQQEAAKAAENDAAAPEEEHKSGSGGPAGGGE